MWLPEFCLFVINLIYIKIAAQPMKRNNLLYSLAEESLHSTDYDETVWEHFNKTCLLNDCDEQVNLQHLQHIATHMNRAINPCENFHAYACGNWQQQYPQQNTAMAQGEQQLNDKYQQMFTKQRLEFENADLKDDVIMKKMQKYLEVCLASESKKKASWHQYIKALRDLGYLHYDNNTNWLKTLRELNLFSNRGFFISLQIERFNVSCYTLSIEPHNILESKNFSLATYELLRIYTNDSYESVASDFKTLEMDLQNILQTSACPKTSADETSDCDLTTWLSYEELLKSNATINWEYLLADFPLASQDQIYVNDLNTVMKIKTYLDRTSQKTLFLYALTQFVYYLQSHSHNIIDKGSDYQSCLRHMRKHFPLALNYLYEQVYYSSKREQSDRVIKEIFSQLKQQFSLILDANEMQLPSDSLFYLKQKLHHLQLNIGNLPPNASQHFYIDYMADLNVSYSFYENHLMALKHFFQHQRLLASAGKFDALWFTFNLHMPNFLDNLDSTAYYFSSANIIILPYAYLQLPFYDHGFWPALLFGDLANTLGHELIHAFDSKFLENDFAGNYNDRESLAVLNNHNFQQHLSCLNKQPTQFLTERIADISGTYLALKTFIRDPAFLKHNGKLFFLQFAQFFCGSSDADAFKTNDDLHDLDSVRLNYTLSHMPEFAEAFQCPLASPMNPLEKCRLW